MTPPQSQYSVCTFTSHSVATIRSKNVNKPGASQTCGRHNQALQLNSEANI